MRRHSSGNQLSSCRNALRLWKNQIHPVYQLLSGIRLPRSRTLGPSAVYFSWKRQRWDRYGIQQHCGRRFICCYRILYHSSNLQGIPHFLEKTFQKNSSPSCLLIRQEWGAVFLIALQFRGNKSEPHRSYPLKLRCPRHILPPDGLFCHLPEGLSPD